MSQTRIPFRSRLDGVTFHAVLAVALATALIGIPVVTFLVTQHQFLRFGERIALNFARNVLARSDRISAEFRAEVPILNAAAGHDPCSPAAVELMRGIAMKYVDIVFVGYERDDRLLCSSFGVHPDGLPLGPVAFRGAYAVRRNIQIGAAPAARLNAIGANGWIFFIAPLQSIDVAAPENVILATYSTLARQIRTSNGPIRPEWLLLGRTGQERSFSEDGHAIGIVESAIYPAGAIAAVPLSVLQPNERFVEWVGVAAAVLAGLSIAAWILHVAKQYRVISRATLTGALRGDEFHLVYQPIVDLTTRHWVGAEALMRWRRAGIDIAPDLFFSAAEKLDLMPKFTERMFSLLAKDAPIIFSTGQPFHVSFNLAASDVKDASIVTRLKKLAWDCGQPPARFKVEITERSVLDEVAGRDVIAAIRAIGMSTIVDDFGTGFSNLKYLSMFQFDGLKIDRAFVSGISSHPVTGEVAFHIIALARSLDLGLIAEGVENEQQAAVLEAHGVRFAQGWLFARPKIAADLAAGLRASVRTGHGAILPVRSHLNTGAAP